jgi:hypothetical protein
MNRCILFLAGLLLLCGAARQPNGLGHPDSLPSTMLKENRKFYVHVPASAAGSAVAPKRYLLVHSFDADAQIAAATSMIQY